MKTETLILLIIALGALVGLYFWARTFKNSFKPIQGEKYIITFFGIHMFEVRLGDPSLRWYQKLPFYLLAEPFGRAFFVYEWVQEIAVSDYLKIKKKEESLKSEDYHISIIWRPKMEPTEIDQDGTPKDKSTIVLVSRKERMYSLRDIEGYTLAAQFETSDTFRGFRLFTLFLSTEDLSKIISKARRWQQASSLTFESEYTAWSKKTPYRVLLETTIDELRKNLGKANEDFVDEINETIREDFGYSIKSVKGGKIYLNPESQDLLDSQEQKKLAQDKLDAAKITAETTQVDAIAEALKITTVEKATTGVIDERTSIALTAANKLNALALEQIKAKYGPDGIGKLPGVFVENGGANNEGTVDVDKLIENVLAFKIAQKTQGGTP